MDLNIKIIYKGKNTLRKFKYFLSKTGIELGQDDGDCVKGWDGWIKVGKNTTLVKNTCIVCFLSNMDYILRKKDGILVEIYLSRLI